MSSDVFKRANPADDYELLQRVGSGTYGEVYKARHIRTGELSAVKVVKLEAGDNFALIQQEILVLRDCVHPNIIAYHGSYLRRDRLWIVMEYCGGGSLQDIYHMTGPLSELQIAFVCRETLKGLNYLHMRGKVHRDVKGANILLTHAGDVKLADFGVAAQITATIGKRKSFIGTPYWMAPEVACVDRRGGYGVQCDVWAVGITAIELAECQPPLFDLQPMQVLYLMTKSSYKPPHLKDKHRWSPLFHDFVRQCLTKSPKKRPTPDRLLATHHFVLGSLSSRMTRDLLDKVNGSASKRVPDMPTDFDDPSSDDESEPSGFLPPSHSQSAGNITPTSPQNGNSGPSLITHVSPPRRYHSENTLPAGNVMQALPDLLNGDPLLQDGDGVIHEDDEDGTLRPNQQPPQRPPRPRRDSQTRGGRAASLDRNGRSADDKVAFRPNAENIDVKRPVTYFGLPPTPKVPMGACFASMLHDCPQRVNCATTWVQGPSNTVSSDGSPSSTELLLLGTEEGIFAVDLNRLHDGEMRKIHHRRCSWMYVYGDVLMAVQGRTPYLYRHDLMALAQNAHNLTLKMSKQMNKLPEKYIPKKLAITIRIPETKDCLQCVVEKGICSKQLYLCCAVPSSVHLFQWYGPLNRFILIQTSEVGGSGLRYPLHPFQVVSTHADYPQVCVGVYRQESDFAFKWVKFGENANVETLANEKQRELLDVVGMKQLDKDTILFAYKDKVVMCDLEGVCRREIILLRFHIDYIYPLSDSFLAFHTHGVEGHSFKDNSLTQELTDPTKMYKVIGSDKQLILKCQKTHGPGDQTDICFLQGHQSTLHPTPR